MSTLSLEGKLVDAEGLLSALFPMDARPTVRWLRAQQKARVVPYYKLGRLVRFDVEEVKAALKKNLRVEAKAA